MPEIIEVKAVGKVARIWFESLESGNRRQRVCLIPENQLVPMRTEIDQAISLTKDSTRSDGIVEQARKFAQKCKFFAMGGDRISLTVEEQLELAKLLDQLANTTAAAEEVPA
ncbi:hypothetical protein [Lysinibacter cavernae]|uniref:hypothetical protein n=1 Tax=Lysinibacter cavernae TaxID=1640652 RepID=UPI003620FF42